MHGDACTTFDTALGACGIAWARAAGGDGWRITAFQLPEPTAGATLRRMFRGGPVQAQAEPPPAVQDIVSRVIRLMDGERIDLRDVPLDYDGIEPFHRQVYEVAREIRAGHTRTYGDIAVQLGAPREARAVGRALGANPFAVIVPCHRVLAAGGQHGGFSAGGGVETKLKLLLIERAQFGEEPGLF